MAKKRTLFFSPQIIKEKNKKNWIVKRFIFIFIPLYKFRPTMSDTFR